MDLKVKILCKIKPNCLKGLNLFKVFSDADNSIICYLIASKFLLENQTSKWKYNPKFREMVSNNWRGIMFLVRILIPSSVIWLQLYQVLFNWISEKILFKVQRNFFERLKRFQTLAEFNSFLFVIASFL